MKYLYKYPQRGVPVRRSRRDQPRARSRDELEYELLDTGIFDDDRYFDVVRRVREGGAGGHPDPDHRAQPRARGGAAARAADAVVPQHLVVGRRRAASRRCAQAGDRRRSRRRTTSSATYWLLCDGAPELLFTENETNAARLSGQPNAVALREGRLPRLRRRAASADAVNPAKHRHEGGGALRARRAGRRQRASSGCACRPPQPGRAVRRGFDAVVRGPASPRPTSSTTRITPPIADRGRAPRASPGAGRHAVEQAVLLLRRRHVARGARRATRSLERAAHGVAEHRLVPHAQRRHHLDARQVGVPVVRGLGPRVPHASRSRWSTSTSPRSSCC